MPYVDSHYGHTLAEAWEAGPLDRDLDVEVCIVGGGMAGLATALDLAERGRSVALVERHRVGWGASGRNGGFVSPGLPTRPPDLVKRFGLDDAKAYYALSRMGLELVRARLQRYGIGCDKVDGSLRCQIDDGGAGLRPFQELMARHFDTELEYWSGPELRDVLATRRYSEALLNREGFAVHPLNMTRGMASAFVAAGGQLFENTPATRLALGPEKSVHTPRGTIRAKHVVVAAGGYAGWLNWRLGAATIPVATYVMTTEPLGDNLRRTISIPYAIFDNSVATNYYRKTPEGRLIWGGRVGITGSSPAKIARALRQDAAAFYPDLKDVRVDTAWSGMMPYTRAHMPSIGQFKPGAWYATGFGGLGMALTTMAGALIAEGITGEDDRWRRFARFGLPFAGGRLGRVPAQFVYWKHVTANRKTRQA